MVAGADAAGLAGRIDELNGLDKRTLRRRFKEQLRAPHQAGSRGAGLGLLDIARRAAPPMLLARTPLTGEWEFVSLLVRI